MNEMKPEELITWLADPYAGECHVADSIRAGKYKEYL